MESGPSHAQRTPRIRFDRNELAGSFGDIGTDLPLLLGMIPAAGLDSASVFTMFGLMQVLTGVLYGLPMPVQPLKAMAVLVISQNLSKNILFGGGLAIGVIMLVLAASGALNGLVRVIPRPVVRGVQFGLGLYLCSLALRDYVPAMGATGYLMATAAFAVMILLWGNRRVPPGLLVMGIGLLYALVFRVDGAKLLDGVGLALPQTNRPSWDDIRLGFLLLALPQLPLSLSNAVIATRQTLEDLFPERRITTRRIGLTYGIINLINPFLSGVPACHGCGGLAGHYAFGARTGGSVVIYGSMYLLIGLLLSGASDQVVALFPRPILGVVLLFEGLTLLLFIRDLAGSARDMTIGLLVGVLAATLPQGFVVGLLVGTAVYYGARRFQAERVH